MAASEVAWSNRSEWERLCSGLAPTVGAPMQWACTYSPGAMDHHISAARYPYTMPTLHPLTMPGPTRLLYGSEIRDHLYGSRRWGLTKSFETQETAFNCNCLLDNYIDCWAFVVYSIFYIQCSIMLYVPHVHAH